MLGRFDSDLAVIGSGDAGSRAALMAKKAGLSVALIEADKWGGTSLNYTDIPNTALFYTAKVLKEAKDVADETIRAFQKQGTSMSIQTMEKKRKNVRENICLFLKMKLLMEI